MYFDFERNSFTLVVVVGNLLKHGKASHEDKIGHPVCVCVCVCMCVCKREREREKG